MIDTQNIDWKAVLQASRTLSGELRLDSLLCTLMRLVLEHTCAEKGFLFIRRAQHWDIVAQARMGENAIARPAQKISFDQKQSLWSTAILQQVALTEKPVVLADAVNQGAFSHCTYVAREQPRSILCSPFHKQNQLIGIFYLENNQTSGVFTSERHELLNIIAEQAAISLENANLYSRLEAQVAERTQALQAQYRQLQDTQDKLIQSEKMASLGTLVAGVAHEINNPTNFSFAGAQNLEQRLKELRNFIIELAGSDASPEVIEMLDARFQPLFSNLASILDGTERITTIVGNLRTFSRLDEAKASHVQLVEYIQSTLALVKAGYKDDIEFVCDFQADPEVTCNPAQLNQVFMNLMINGCQAILERHKQDPNAPPGLLTVKTYEANEALHIAFQDNGCGIPPDVRERIFEPFYTTKSASSGTGLGLSISHGIIEKHGGTIEIESTQGQGTTFTLILPL